MAAAIKDSFNCGGIMSSDPSPCERLFVLLDLDAIEFDSAQQGGQRHRNEALLPGAANHDHVRVDRVAQKTFGQSVRIDRMEVLLAYGSADCGNAIARAQAGIALLDEVAREHLRRIDKCAGVIALIGDRRFGRRTDNDVTTNQAISTCWINAYLVDVRWLFGDPEVAQYRSKLLGEAHEVEFAGAFALNVRSHRDECANRDHAGSADAGYEEVVAMIDLRNFCFG